LEFYRFNKTASIQKNVYLQAKNIFNFASNLSYSNNYSQKTKKK